MFFHIFIYINNNNKTIVNIYVVKLIDFMSIIIDILFIIIIFIKG